MSDLHIDADFPTGKGCKFHCWPSVHPAQVDPKKKVYGCTHPAWPANRQGDWPPIVHCEGELLACDLMKFGRKWYFGYIRGITQRIKNAEKKIEKYRNLLFESQILKTPPQEKR